MWPSLIGRTLPSDHLRAAAGGVFATSPQPSCHRLRFGEFGRICHGEIQQAPTAGIDHPNLPLKWLKKNREPTSYFFPASRSVFSFCRETSPSMKRVPGTLDRRSLDLRTRGFQIGSEKSSHSMRLTEQEAVKMSLEPWVEHESWMDFDWLGCRFSCSRC